MPICYECKIWMKDTNKAETLSYIKCNSDGMVSDGFQRWDVYECPNCFKKSYGTSGQRYYYKDMKEDNPQLRDWGDVFHDAEIVENVDYDLDFNE